jgi:hypothetical protein
MPKLSEESKPQQRITLPLSPDGASVDWEHVRPTVAEKFEGLLRTDPNIKRAYQEENQIPGEIPEELAITEANVAKLLDGITAINASLFQLITAKWIKHPLGWKDVNGKNVPFVIEPDILAGMKLTEKQHAELDPRGVKIAKRFEDVMPDWLKRNFDIYMFASMFISYTAENMKACMVGQVTRDLARARQSFVDKKMAETRPGDSDRVPTNGAERKPEPPSEEPPQIQV